MYNYKTYECSYSKYTCKLLEIDFIDMFHKYLRLAEVTYSNGAFYIFFNIFFLRRVKIFLKLI